MARSKKKNRLRQQKFAQANHAKRVARAIDDEQHKTEQVSHLKQMAELKLEILNRTIFVDKVRVENRWEIQAYFEQNFGPVEDCLVAKKKYKKNRRGASIPSSVHVRFRAKIDAERAFLNGSSGFPPSLCRNNKWKINVYKAQEYEGMLRNVVDGTEISIASDRLAIGHYFSRAESLEFENSISNDTAADGDAIMASEEWLEELNVDGAFNFQIDLTALAIKLTLETDGREDHLFIRVKELFGPIEVCRCEMGTYCLVLALKHPPKFFTKDLTQPNAEDADPIRCLSFGSLNAEDFGACCALKLNVSETHVFGLLLNKGLATLRSFGMIRSDVRSVEDAINIRCKFIGRSETERHFEQVHLQDSTVGLMLRSCMDAFKFCWYDAIHETTEIQGVRYNVFAFVQAMCLNGLSSSLTEDNWRSRTGRTRFPCRALHALVEFEAKQEKPLPGHCVTIPRVLLSPSRHAVLGIEVETSNRVVRDFVAMHKFSSHDFLRVKVGDESGRKLFWSDFKESVVARIKSSMQRGLIVNGRKYEFLAYSSSQLKDCSLWMVYIGTSSLSVRDMWRIMGDFSKCLTPSKVAARMGQCFSTTFQGLDSHNTVQQASPGVRHVVIDDVLSSDEGLVHSDGNGLIRQSKMSSLLKQLPSLRKNRELDHSIVQIRYGGAKGTLVAWDDSAFDDGLRASGCKTPHLFDVAVRKSMVKFDTEFARLEVCCIGSAAPYYLNRNVILLLKSQGVDENVFLQMQKEMLDDLDLMFTDSMAAFRMISRLSGPDHEQRARLMAMLKSGLEVGKDPFLFSCSLAIRSHQLLGLRKKARIFVNDGAVLMGGLDVLKVLPEHCVFVQVRKSTPGAFGFEESEQFEPVVGPVLVTKHPVMHPGDVRMLLAVDVPELRHHKNVILFSQVGERPEADKMGGSDLDGDEFAVTWDSRLFLGEWNKCRVASRHGRILSGTRTGMGQDAKALQHTNKVPMSYSSSSGATPFPLAASFHGADLDSIFSAFFGQQLFLNKRTTPTSEASTTTSTTADHGRPETNGKGDATCRISDEELVAHFVNFAINDKLGPICMLWQDWASKCGADCSECLLLAEQHSVAVDFAKSGIPADLPKETKWTGPKAHWREKKEDLEPYHCSSVVGKLYDQVFGGNGLTTLQDYTVALAGRTVDRYGQVLSTVSRAIQLNRSLEIVYQAHIPISLGWSFVEQGSRTSLQAHLSWIADEQRASYEDQVTQVMNKYALRNEGELATGCIRKYQSLNKNRQHEVSQEVRRHGREIYQDHRSTFFRHVLLLTQSSTVVMPDVSNGHHATPEIVTDFESLETDDADISVDELDWVQAVTTNDESTIIPDSGSKEWLVRNIAQKLAAAYYLSAYSPSRSTYHGILLFGFPWVVSDVIACGIAHTRVPNLDTE